MAAVWRNGSGSSQAHHRQWAQRMPCGVAGQPLGEERVEPAVRQLRDGVFHVRSPDSVVQQPTAHVDEVGPAERLGHPVVVERTQPVVLSDQRA